MVGLCRADGVHLVYLYCVAHAAGSQQCGGDGGDVIPELVRGYDVWNRVRIKRSDHDRRRNTSYLFRGNRLEGSVDLVGDQDGAFTPQEGARRLQLRSPRSDLRTDPEILFERMQNKGLPLFLREDPSIAQLARLWNERHAVYAQLADHTIDNTHYTITTTADCVMAALRESA